MAPTYTGTEADNSWTVVQAMSFSLDGLGGVDTIAFGTSLRTDYVIVTNADKSVSIDSVSAASAALHATLYNVELLVFNDGTDTLDLRSNSADVTAPLLTSSSLAGAPVAIDADLILTFNEAVKFGSGALVLQQASGAVLDAAVSINGNTVTIKPVAKLAPGATYQLQIGAGALLDLAGNAFHAGAALSFGTVPAPVQQGGPGNDILHAGPGHFPLDGGAGTDTVVFAMARGAAAISRAGNTVTVSAGGASDVLTNVERLAFSDTSIALDIDGIGGQAYRLYQAAFNRVPDTAGVGYWITMMDRGASLTSVAQGFVQAPEFVALYSGMTSNAEIVARFYSNVLRRPGEDAGIAYWAGLLDSKVATVPDVLAGFSESAENQLSLIGTIGNGFAYLPFT